MSGRIAGIPAAPGIAVGPVWRYRPRGAGGVPVLAVASRGEAELRIRRAADAAAAQLQALAERLCEMNRPGDAEILAAQALMAIDPAIVEEAVRLARGGMDPVEAVLAAADALREQVLNVGFGHGIVADCRASMPSARRRQGDRKIAGRPAGCKRASATCEARMTKAERRIVGHRPQGRDRSIALQPLVAQPNGPPGGRPACACTATTRYAPLSCCPTCAISATGSGARWISHG